MPSAPNCASKTVGEFVPRTCQWIEGDPHARRTKGDAIFCPKKVVPDTSYCAEHLERSRYKAKAGGA